ncbi:hypothetical protein [Citrobacter portucalensis]|jgi:hypothetical protein|uniref:hypothetical protein n=1 Tax=Citrobacter portucalensis TaxID=1639133 RepID=UPI001D8CD2BF|nr:hypothetical protein [Citrobacter portucalensis]MCX8990084.1 hypothetical protein [Citrobacter portucalensis]
MKVGIYSLAFASDVEAAHQLQPLGMNVRTLQRHLEEGGRPSASLSMKCGATWRSRNSIVPKVVQINYSNLAYG